MELCEPFIKKRQEELDSKRSKTDNLVEQLFKDMQMAVKGKYEGYYKDYKFSFERRRPNE